MDKYDIKDYSEQLEQMCVGCRKFTKCDHKKICFLKKFAFNMAKVRMKRREKGV